jgi:putative transposase
MIEVRYQGRPMGQAVPRRIRRHTHPQARPETAPPAKASGIDYLGLVAARVAAEQARRIAYSAINPQATDDTDTDTDTTTEKPR